jgi:transposase-like protein
MAVAMSELDRSRVSDPDPEVPERASRRTWSAAYKLAILAEYEGLDRDRTGALLRREGLYTSLISEWRKQRDKGALAELAAPPGRPPADRSSARPHASAVRTRVFGASSTPPAG